MTGESYVTRCLLRPKQGEKAMFVVNKKHEVLARLEGYAVIPIEEYESLTNKKYPFEPHVPTGCQGQ